MEKVNLEGFPSLVFEAGMPSIDADGTNSGVRTLVHSVIDGAIDVILG